MNWTHCCSVCTLTSRPPGRPITEQFNEYNNERIVLWPSYQILISTPMADFGMIKCQTIIKTPNVGASFEKLVFIPPLEYQELENPTSSSTEDVVTACGSQKLYFDILYLPPNSKSKSSHVTLKHKSCLLLFSLCIQSFEFIVGEVADRLAHYMAGRLRGNCLKRTIKPWPSADRPSGAT